MSERPMLFSAPMVQALLAGRKTQTRRIAKPRRHASILQGHDPKDLRPENQWADSYIFDPGNAEWLARDVPAHAGEQMYVREAFRFGAGYDGLKPSLVAAPANVFYEADAEAATGWEDLKVGKLRPGIHMPRWCSRIERIIVGCRLERLNDCSAEDARAEGLEWVAPSYGIAGIAPSWQADPVAAYRALWEHINGSGSWEANPLVWVIEFRGGA